MKSFYLRCALAAAVSAGLPVSTFAQATTPDEATNGNGSSAAAGVYVPAGYVIGQEDVLSVVFWRDKEMSADVVVRPDGKISLPLLNDIQAAGYSPEQLRAQIEKAASKYIAEPNATVIVKAINSRKVHVIGNVGKPGTYPLGGEMTVLQLVALAGGLQEWADASSIKVMRKENGRDQTLKFNYKDVVKGKNLHQNVILKPGDTVIVP